MKWSFRCTLIGTFMILAMILAVTVCFSADASLASNYKVNNKLSKLLIKEGVKFDLIKDAAI